jgi:hypothetical protein
MSSRQTRKLTKPRLLAYARQADYGDIHHPTLPCNDPKRTPQPEKDYISKSMTRRKAFQEIRETSAWRKRNFDFALVPEDYCEGEGTLREGRGKNRKSLEVPRYLLLSKYGGLPVNEVSKDLIAQGHRIVRYMNALVELRDNVAQMNKESFFHNDITDRNITYDEKKGKAFLIDFEHADREPAKPKSNIASNNSYKNIDPNDESVLIQNNIEYFSGNLKDIGIFFNQIRTPSRSSRSTSSSRTRSTKKMKRPHSI